MSERRFYVDPAAVRGGEATLTGPERDHLVRVLRLGAGDEVVLFDGRGREFAGRVLEAGRREVRLSIGEPRAAAAEDGRARVVLLQGLPRLARMDWLVEKTTEAGVSALVPIVARRSPAEARRAAARLERWRTIAREACRQCGRAVLPEIESPVGCLEIWGRSWASGRRALLTPEGERGMREWLEEIAASEWVVAVGAEGGWDPEEIGEARRAGFETVSMGARVLRAETAALVAVAAVQLARGDLSGSSRLKR